MKRPSTDRLLTAPPRRSSTPNRTRAILAAERLTLSRSERQEIAELLVDHAGSWSTLREDDALHVALALEGFLAVQFLLAQRNRGGTVNPDDSWTYSTSSAARWLDITTVTMHRLWGRLGRRPVGSGYRMAWSLVDLVAARACVDLMVLGQPVGGPWARDTANKVRAVFAAVHADRSARFVTIGPSGVAVHRDAVAVVASLVSGGMTQVVRLEDPRVQENPPATLRSARPVGPPGAEVAETDRGDGAAGGGAAGHVRTGRVSLPGGRPGAGGAVLGAAGRGRDRVAGAPAGVASGSGGNPGALSAPPPVATRASGGGGTAWPVGAVDNMICAPAAERVL